MWENGGQVSDRCRDQLVLIFPELKLVGTKEGVAPRTLLQAQLQVADLEAALAEITTQMNDETYKGHSDSRQTWLQKAKKAREHILRKLAATKKYEEAFAQKERTTELALERDKAVDMVHRLSAELATRASCGRECETARRFLQLARITLSDSMFERIMRGVREGQ